MYVYVIAICYMSILMNVQSPLIQIIFLQKIKKKADELKIVKNAIVI